MIFFKYKKEKNNKDLENPIINKNLPGIIKTIEEFSDEQRDIIGKFKKEMERFTEERSIETCLQALNLSMQLANTREKILDAYKQYIGLLEIELKKQINQGKGKV